MLALTMGLAILLLSSMLVFASPNAEAGRIFSNEYNHAGNVMITDQFNNRVIEVNPTTNQIVWSFGSGDPNDTTVGPGHVIAPNYAERIGMFTVICGTGTGDVPDNRVIVVNQAGAIIWQYGMAGVAGDGPNQLNVPVSAVQLFNEDFLITDQGNNRIIEVDMLKNVVWSYGPDSGPGALNSPNSAELVKGGNILIADEGNSRAIEIDRAGNIVWQYSDGMNLCAFASRLPNGNTLLTDSGNARILEVNRFGTTVFQYFTNTSVDSNPAPLPSNAVRTKDRNIMIADQYNDRVFLINQRKQIVWQYGAINVTGNTSGLLNAPYTAFVIGDYTGQTLPPHFNQFLMRAT